MSKSNYNEQYSRKNNIKIMGVREDINETVEMLEDKICEILNTKAGLTIDPRKIHAMRERKKMKEAGFRLVDDVTKLNTELINRLTMHKDISSVWFFNGSVFGKTDAGKRHKFDLYCDIDTVINAKLT